MPEYPNLLVAHAVQCAQDSARWFGIDVVENIPHMTLCLAGEVGELANLVKKIQRGDLDWNDPDVQFKVRMEMTDVYVYLMNLCALTSTNMEAAYEVKRKENLERFTHCAKCNVMFKMHEEVDHAFEWPEDIWAELQEANREEKQEKSVPGSFTSVKDL